MSRVLKLSSKLSLLQKQSLAVASMQRAMDMQRMEGLSPEVEPSWADQTEEDAYPFGLQPAPPSGPPPDDYAPSSAESS